jgi:hypothetical protein
MDENATKEAISLNVSLTPDFGCFPWLTPNHINVSKLTSDISNSSVAKSASQEIVIPFLNIYTSVLSA